MNKNKIAVILGGTSTEREISLRSGEAVYHGLIKKGYDAVKIDPKLDNLYQRLVEETPAMAFIALHGMGGEDGLIQGFLETLGIPYTGNSLLSSAITMNKIFTQNILKSNNIKVPDFFTLSRKEYELLGAAGVQKKIEATFGFPAIVKAPSQGSTLGIYFINDTEKPYETQLAQGIEGAFQLEDILLIEKMITPSTEITVSVLGNKEPVALPTLEITTVTGYYDYTTKYTQGMCSHIIPARLPKSVRKKAQEVAVATYQLLQCKGFARVDFMVQDEDVYMIDINTIPGMTDMSLLPDAARSIGIEFPELIDLIIQLAKGEEFPIESYREALAGVEA